VAIVTEMEHDPRAAASHFPRPGRLEIYDDLANAQRLDKFEDVQV